MVQSFVVQCFVRERKGGLTPMPSIEVSSPDAARRVTRRLMDRAAFAVAIASSDDGNYLIEAVGEVPEDFLEMPIYTQ